MTDTERSPLEMAHLEWYALVEAEYELVSYDLQTQGYTRTKSHDFYKWHYTKPGQPTLVIVRELGSPNWWIRELGNA